MRPTLGEGEHGVDLSTVAITRLRLEMELVRPGRLAGREGETGKEERQGERQDAGHGHTSKTPPRGLTVTVDGLRGD